MKKLRKMPLKRLSLSRETLANLDQLAGNELEKVAAGGSATTCHVPPHCTCF